MSESKGIRLAKVAKELNISHTSIVEHLSKKGHEISGDPNGKISDEHYQILLGDFNQDKKIKEQADQITIGRHSKQGLSLDDNGQITPITKQVEKGSDEILIKNLKTTPFVPEKPTTLIEAAPPKEEKTTAPASESGIKVLGKIDLSTFNKPKRDTPPVVVEEHKKVEPAPVTETPKEVSKPVEAAKVEVLKSEPVQPVSVSEPKLQAQPTVEVPKQETPTIEKPKVESAPIVKEHKVEAPKVETPREETPKVEIAKVETQKVDVPVKQAHAQTPQVQKPHQSPSADNTKPIVPKVETPKVETPANTETPPTPPGSGEEEGDVIRAKAERLSGTTILGKIDLTQFQKKPSAPQESQAGKRKRKRKEGEKAASSSGPVPNTGGPRPQGTGTPRPAGQGGPNQGGGQRPQGQGQGGGAPRTGHSPNYKGNNPVGGGPRPNTRPGGPNDRNRAPIGPKAEPTEKDIQDQIKATLARLSGGTKGGAKKGSSYKKDKKTIGRLNSEAEEMMAAGEKVKIQATEFLTTQELAQLMDVTVNEVIGNIFSLGMMVSINQRLDAETIAFVADEFGFEVEFISADANEPEIAEEDNEENITDRSPIVTIMGHVDHGKTSLLDFIRNTNVIAGEAGGITQHIGAYEVKLENGKKITFLDTPGHEAFTAMRARGAKVTDTVVIVIAADDSVMPQTKEAISHAQAAGVPLIFAINKIDRPGANPEKIREQLSAMNILVESWGGKYQDQEISAKQGLNIDALLEKILLEAEILDLKADPKKRAVGTVIEAELDKGKGIVTTVLIQSGTLNMGDDILAGPNYGRVKALYNERGMRVKTAGPSQPVQILGFNGAPQAGDIFYVTENEATAKDISIKRAQIIREQGLRTKKHITLDEIGRRLAIGNFKELNVIIKGDYDGSVEALSDSLQKLSTDQIVVNVIHKGVGQISESDVLLASASDAIIVGFQVRPFPGARKLAEQEEIEIRTYSIIYDAIDEIRSAMEGMLAPTFEEKIVCNVQVREVFKISKVGTIAGCMVLDGKITRNTKIRVVRDGVVVHTGEIDSLKRFKDDVKEVLTNYECGISLKSFNDLRTNDIIEGFERIEVKSKL